MDLRLFYRRERIDINKTDINNLKDFQYIHICPLHIAAYRM